MKAREDDLEATKAACTKVDNDMRWVYYVFRPCDWMNAVLSSSIIGLYAKESSFLSLVSCDVPTDPSRRRGRRRRKERTMLKRLLDCTSIPKMPKTSATPEETLTP